MLQRLRGVLNVSFPKHQEEGACQILLLSSHIHTVWEQGAFRGPQCWDLVGRGMEQGGYSQVGPTAPRTLRGTRSSALFCHPSLRPMMHLKEWVDFFFSAGNHLLQPFRVTRGDPEADDSGSTAVYGEASAHDLPCLRSAPGA